MKHVAAVLFACEDITLQESAGFLVTQAQCQRADDGEVRCADDFADCFGQLTTSLATHRLRRSLYLISGWPWSTTAAFDTAHADATLARFADDLRVWRTAQELPGKLAGLNVLFARHPFNKASFQQLISAQADRHQPDFLSKLQSVLRPHCRVACPTQLIEDMVGPAKNVKVVKKAQKFRRLELAMASILKHNVLDVRHTWATVSAETPIGAKSVRLDSSAFQSKVDNRSMKWNEVASHVATPDFDSPKAENFSSNQAALPLLKACLEAGDLNLAADAWLGQLFTNSHRLIFQLPGDADCWCPSLHHFDKSSVLAWPGKLVKVDGYEPDSFARDSNVSMPVLVPIWKLDGINGCTYKWRSYAWQWRSFPNCRSSLLCRVLPFIEAGPIDILELAAKNTFWKMTRTQIADLVRHCKGLVIPDGASLCCALDFTLKQFYPMMSDVGRMDILSLRLAVNDLPASFTSALLEIDEAQVAMDRQDIQKLGSEQEVARAMEVENNDFLFEYFKIRSTIAPKKKPTRSSQHHCQNTYHKRMQKPTCPPRHTFGEAM